ncbi:MAG: hypothetical protein ACI9S8_002660 [Chlamydiales bacterium]|jgi:hypothetical protein
MSAPGVNPNPTDIVKLVNTEGATTAFQAKSLIEIVAQETHNAQKKIDAIQDAGSAISISDMFEMQMRMNRLSQFSEMSTAVVGAANSAISSIARNVK